MNEEMNLNNPPLPDLRVFGVSGSVLMEAKIIELMLLLSIENDLDLINSLYSKLNELNKKNNINVETKYSIENISDRDKATMYMGFRKIIWNTYTSEEEMKADRLSINFYRYCDTCFKDGHNRQCYTECPFKKRRLFLESITDKHEKIRSNILTSLPKEYILNKYLVNKINNKLLKIKNYETSKQ